jgi:hypothetical protein
MQRHYYYLVHNGGLWRLSRPEAHRLLRALDAGEEFNLDDYGALLSYHVLSPADPEGLRAELARPKGR